MTTGSSRFHLKRCITLLCAIAIFFPLFTKTVTGDIEDSIMTSEGVKRTYFLHIPPCFDDSTMLPLVINLHGGGMSGQSEANLSQMNAKADSACFMVAYPDGFYGWSEQDTLFLLELMDNLRARYSIDSSRVYLTGFSAGGFMSHVLACWFSEKIAAFAPVCGAVLKSFWPYCYPKVPVSIISFNARNDYAVPYGGDDVEYGVQEGMELWAGRLGCDIGPDSFYSDSGALRQTWRREDGRCELVLWTTDEGGHDWPGPLKPQKLAANDLMWDFFKAHQLTHGEPAVDENRRTDAVPSRCTIYPANICITNHAVNVQFWLQSSERISLKLYDAAGKQVAVIKEGVFEAGRHEVVIDASTLEAGVYFYRLSYPHGAQTRSISVIR
jgi:polyhydroxybutyrate depolymerase